MRDLLPDAHALALSSGLTVYDSMYVTLAVRLKTQVITADGRLMQALAAHPMTAVHVRRIEDFSE